MKTPPLFAIMVGAAVAAAHGCDGEDEESDPCEQADRVCELGLAEDLYQSGIDSNVDGYLDRDCEDPWRCASRCVVDADTCEIAGGVRECVLDCGFSEIGETGGTGPTTPMDCYNEYLFKRGDDCTVADCGGSPLLTCINEFDCTTCSDKCAPPECTTDADCQQFADLCPGVQWICDGYQLGLACTVDFDG